MLPLPAPWIIKCESGLRRLILSVVIVLLPNMLHELQQRIMRSRHTILLCLLTLHRQRQKTRPKSMFDQR
jgi:hypothetical protein